MKIRILLYITPKFKWKYIVNWLISVWTRSKYSHAEVWTAGKDGKFVSELTPYYPCLEHKCCLHHVTHPCEGCGRVAGNPIMGTCWTATMRGDANGTVKRPASEVLDKPERWVYFEIEMDDDEFGDMEHWMTVQVLVNKGYSKWDLLKFLSPIHFPDNERNICSEFVNNALYYAEIIEKKGIISPKKLHKKLIKLGYKQTSLSSNPKKGI